jgi:hypothetical protein
VGVHYLCFLQHFGPKYTVENRLELTPQGIRVSLVMDDAGIAAIVEQGRRAMAWEARGKGRYYYSSARVDGRVVRTYHGSGRSAAQVARQHALAREAAQADTAAAQALEQEYEPLERLADEADEQVDLLLEIALLAGGFHEHKGQWRRRHGSYDQNKASTRGSSGQPEDSPQARPAGC